MTETNSCVEKGALIDYLYGEADAEARARVEAHLRTCVQCADEVSGLKDVRGNLEAWVPPQAELGFRLVSDAEPEPVTISVWSRLRRPPVWGLATAAAVVLAAAVAITKPELEIGGGEMVLRIGWSDAGSDAATQPEATSQVDPPMRGAELPQPVQPLRSTPVAAGRQSPDVTAAADESLLRAVDQRLREEELIANQRQADLTEIQRAFGEFEVTGADRPRQQLLDYLRRVSAR
ncbi:MAG: hypothetical protein CL477_12690 [Acidobacteria bacterium]|jgi:hypothetical protein|nr:hypothetical protein [Acidobacteriota bacterium]MDP7692627.1 zf-HC2 domain-containing protein [Vicinamibacterales bacterium]HJN43562.1 zf-HC2 domain-containing protein [Vicinamibacterales bacterium]